MRCAESGPFALYRLTKQSLDTREAVDAIAKKWKLPRNKIAFAGLKDKHALTKQYLTIQDGPRRGILQTNLELEYVGQRRELFTQVISQRISSKS